MSRVCEFMDQIDQRQKTLVFCATQDHAARVRNFINQVKTNPDPHYCERVTADDGKLGEQHLRELGQRKDPADDPHDLAETLDRGGRAQRAERRAAAAGEVHD